MSIDTKIDTCVHRLFQDRAKECRDTVAIVNKKYRITYGELDDYSNQIANYLQSLGVKVGHKVAIYLERSWEAIAAILGIMKSGAAYVPLDASYPKDRLALILQDAAPHSTITQKSLTSNLGVEGRNIIVLEETKEKIIQQSCQAPADIATPQDLIYIIYTSGTTGIPKGVMLTHRSVVNLVYSAINGYDVRKGDRMLQFFSFGFDSSVEEIFPCLATGATMHLRTDDMIESAKSFWTQCAEWDLTWIELSTAYWHFLVERLDEIGPEKLPNLRCMILGGEKVLSERVIEWQHRFGTKYKLVNSYGPTEAAVTVTIHPNIAEYPLHSPSQNTPIGTAVPNIKLYIVDEQLHQVPDGTPGELCIAGVGLALGYLNHPDWTNDKFVPNPFSPEVSAKMYRTGDLCRYMTDGNIEYIGRIDQQVKISGYRVELQEIEVVLRTYAGIREAVVLAQEISGGRKRLVGYLECDVPSDVGQFKANIRKFVGQKLPKYMIPQEFVFLNRIPFNTNSKVDRKQLATMAPKPVELPPEQIPQNDIEKSLVELTQEVLGHPQVGVLDNLVELGLHSISAMHLIAKIREVLHVDLPMRSLLDHNTIRSLADLLAVKPKQESAPLEDFSRYQIIPDTKNTYEPFPLSEIQQAYWIGRTGAMELGQVSCHEYIEFNSTTLNIPRLEKAWQKIVERHSLLRAVILPDGQQKILEAPPPYKIVTLDLRKTSSVEKEKALMAIRDEMSHQVLPSDRWPLFDIRASYIQDNVVRLHFSYEVLIVDGWSLEILTNELFKLYTNPETVLPDLDISFRDYVIAERKLRQTELYKRSEKYWEERLPNMPIGPNLPLAKNPSTIKKPKFVRKQSFLKPEVWGKIKSLSQSHGVTMTAALMTAYAYILGTWSRKPEFSLNLPMFNRLPLHPQINQIIGDFTCLTFVSFHLRPENSFAKTVSDTQRQIWDNLENRYMSGLEILKRLEQLRGEQQKILMPVIFTSLFLNPSEARVAIPFDMNLTYGITQTPQVWLDHQSFEIADGLYFWWDAVEELFPSSMLDDMFQTYTQLLNRLGTDPQFWEKPVPHLIPQKQLEWREKINATQAPIPNKLLHTMFESQVWSHRDSCAVSTWDRNLSYRELHSRSNQIARKLRELGTKPNELVAIVMEKGWEQVVAALAILTAGSAYVPINAELPPERITYLLENIQSKIVLTQTHLQSKLSWPKNVYAIAVNSDEVLRWTDRALEPVQSPTDIAYVIFTSGSTGNPKGVVIDHRGAVNTICDLNERFKVNSKDGILALSSLSFDLSVYDIFGMLAVGGTVVIPKSSYLRDPAQWVELLINEKITIWNTVPALMNMLADYMAGHPQIRLNNIRLVMMSGDWIPVALPNRIKSFMENATLYSLGGATEASIWSILHPIQPEDSKRISIPYGRPMLNQTFSVLDDYLRPCPVWVPGNLYIGGIGLAKGYWHDPEKTNAKFIIHPITKERLYLTGDLGRYMPDGNIEFMGREDFQVKIQGYRIELGEIEYALSQYPAIRSSVVAVKGDTSKTLVGYVVLQEKAQHDFLEETVSPEEQSKQEYQLKMLEYRLKNPGIRQNFPELHTNSPKEGTTANVTKGAISLVRPSSNDAFIKKYIERRSYRKFLQTPIPLDTFSNFINCLMQVRIANMPKYRYASAGGIYPMQTYVYVKSKRVAQVPAGIYYYHPMEHQLILVNTTTELESYFQDNDELQVFHDCGFAIFIVAKISSITPIYRRAYDFCQIEAGIISHLLETSGREHNIGLCQMGLDFSKFHSLFAPEDDSCIVMNSLFGGPIEPAWDKQFAQDAGVSKQPQKARQNLTATLQTFLKTKLPEYMVPSIFIPMEQLPLNSNGKVDLKLLPDPYKFVGTTMKTYIPPRSEIEKTIATIWQDVLQVPKVGVHDNFFDLMGNSLKMVQVYNRLTPIFPMKISMVDMFFTYPTIAGISQYITDKQITGNITQSDTLHAVENKQQANPSQASHTDDDIADLKTVRITSYTATNDMKTDKIMAYERSSSSDAKTDKVYVGLVSSDAKTDKLTGVDNISERKTEKITSYSTNPTQETTEISQPSSKETNQSTGELRHNDKPTTKTQREIRMEQRQKEKKKTTEN